MMDFSAINLLENIDIKGEEMTEIDHKKEEIT